MPARPAPAPARRRRAAARQARRRLVERRAAAREARSTRGEGRPHRHARSARDRDCCRCASARRPSSRRCCSTRRRSTSRRSASASRRPPATPKARSCAPCDVAFSGADARSGAAAFRRPRSSQVPPAYRGAQVRGAHLLRVRARRHRRSRASPRAIEIDAIELVDWSPPRAVLRVACSKGTYIRVLAEDIAGALGALRASRRVAADRRGAVRARRRGDARGASRRWTPRRATRCCCRPTRRSPALARLDVDATTAQALVAGRVGRVAAGSVRTIPLLRSAGPIPRTGRSDRRRAALGAPRAYGRRRTVGARPGSRRVPD